MSTFKAAYLPASFGGNGAGTLLTTEAQQSLSETELIQAALPLLSEVNEMLSSIGDPLAKESDIVVGEWSE